MTKQKPYEIDVKSFLEYEKKKIVFKPNTEKVEYVSPKEYAKLTGKHPMTIHKWLRQGRIEGAYKFGNYWKIPYYL